MKKTEQIKKAAQVLNLTGLKENAEKILKQAEEKEYTYTEFLDEVLSGELRFRSERARNKRIKEAGFPYPKKLEEFDINFQKS